jgi:hypothetical protein
MRRVYLRAKSRSDQELRIIALGVHEGRIITNVQVQKHQWRLYALRQPPLNIEFMKVTRGDMAKLKKFSEEIEAWKKGKRCSHLKS